MSLAGRIAAALLLSAAGLVLPGALHADNAAPSGVADPGAFPAELQDRAFDRYVDLRQVGAAIARQDTAHLADLVLGLAQGERVLLRSHKAMSADQLLQVTLRLAVARKDFNTLKRLESGAKGLDPTNWAMRVKVAMNFIGATRARPPVVTFTPEQIDAGVYAQFRSMSNQIQEAEALGDRERLEALAKEVAGLSDLGSDHRTFLAKWISGARSSLPQKPDAEDNGVLKKLTAGSRGGAPIVIRGRQISPQQRNFLANPRSQDLSNLFLEQTKGKYNLNAQLQYQLTFYAPWALLVQAAKNPDKPVPWWRSILRFSANSSFYTNAPEYAAETVTFHLVEVREDNRVVGYIPTLIFQDAAAPPVAKPVPILTTKPR